MRMDLFEKIRPDGFMIFFAIDDRVSFDRVVAWQAEIQTVNDETPILLVASKSDLRHGQDFDEDLIGMEEVKMKCEELGLQGFIETSAFLKREDAL